jgi:hypothetical protein
VCTLIIAAGNGFESFLPSSIPNLEFNGLPVNIYRSDFEIYADGRHKVIVENIVL